MSLLFNQIALIVQYCSLQMDMKYHAIQEDNSIVALE